MPSDDYKKVRDLMILIGNQYLSLYDKSKAKNAFTKAATNHLNIEKESNGTIANKITKKQNEFVDQEILDEINWRGFPVRPTIGDRAEQTESNRLKLLPYLFGALGFVVSILIKPTLEAFGKAVIAPIVARQLNSKEMLSHLKPNND